MLMKNRIRSFFKNLEIKYKIFLLSVFAYIIGIMIFSLLFMFFHIQYTKEKEYKNALVHSQIISKNITFNLEIAKFDRMASEKTKSQIQHFFYIDNLDLVVVYASDSSVFTYLKKDEYKGNIPLLKEIIPGFNRKNLILLEPIRSNNKILGYLLLVYNNKIIYDQVYRYLRYIIILVLVSLIVVFVFVSFLQRIISHPILELANLTKEITENEKFSIKLETDRKDEIGILYHVFSNMLEKINYRDSVMRQTNENLQYTKTFLKNVIDSMPSVLISIDNKFRINQWNLVASNFFNKNEKDVLGKNIYEVERLFTRYKEGINYVINYKESVKYSRNILIINDQKIYVNILIFPLSIENIYGGAVIRIDDITELEKKEEQLRQAQKMESIGLLAGGIAHDFNNLLAGIVGVITLLDYKLNNNIEISKEELMKSISNIFETTKRATDLVRHMLALSRKQDMYFEKINIKEALENIIKICKNTFDRSIEIIYEDRLYSSSALVFADQSQIEQAFLNIAINASHAMTIMRKDDGHKGGKLIFSIEKIVADKNFIEYHPQATLDVVYFVVKISDTGIGISKEILDKIFDPFFTTKDKTKGTGLGLSIVYNIIKQHNGFITVYSELGKGTSFNIYLPRISNNDKDFNINREDKVMNIKKGRGTILVIDDEEMIQEIASDILRECGYKVLTASNGNEGIEIFQQNIDKISLVILDLNMPGMDGRETYLKLKEIKEDIKVVICSGFIHDDRLRNLIDKNKIIFIQKPFTLKQLSDVVYRVLYEQN